MNAVTASGDLRVARADTFATDASISTVSGDATVRVAPAGATRIAVGTISGGIRAQGQALADQRQDRRSLSGTLGGGTATLAIHPTSGDVGLTAAP